MNLFATIFRRIKTWLRQRKIRRRNKEVIIKIRKVQTASNAEVENLLFAISNTGESEFQSSINNVAEIKSKVELSEVSFVDSIKITSVRKLLELYELESELNRLNRSYYSLEIRYRSIKKGKIPDTSFFDLGIRKLEKTLSDTQRGPHPVFNRESSVKLRNHFVEQEILLDKTTLFEKYADRETKRREKEEATRRQIKERLSVIETLVDQNKLNEAKTRIAILDNQLRIIGFNREKERFVKVKERYQEKELQNIKRAQELIKKKLEEQAEASRKESERKLKIENERIRQEEEYKIELEKTRQNKENQLKSLLIRKSNWEDFHKTLRQNKVVTFYHFTDRSNIDSIKLHQGLYSQQYCNLNKIEMKSGNSELGRNLDEKYKLQDYVRLSFISDHPMKHVALKEGRINDPVYLKISIDVCYFLHTRFSNMNATDKGHKNSDNLTFFRALKFDLFKKRYFDLSGHDKKFYQAEILVKTWVPIQYITNIDEF